MKRKKWGAIPQPRYIYLLFENLNTTTAGWACINANEREKEKLVRKGKESKRIEAQRVSLPTPSQAIDALIGDEEQNGKQKKETESRSPTQLLWIIQSL